MDRLTFVAQLIAATAWPAATLVLVLILRPAMKDLLLFLRKLKWGDLEAEFGRDLEHVREIVDEHVALQTLPATSDKFPEPRKAFLLRLADLSPRSVVLESWRELEATAIKILGDHDPSARNQGRPGVLATHALVDTGILDEAGFQVLTILRNLRNRAAHESDFPLSKADAVEYALMAQNLASHLGRIQSEVSR